VVDPSVRVLPVVADLSRPRHIQSLVRKTVHEFGRIDILVTNAGGPPVATFPILDDEQWEQGIALNLMSTIRCIRAVIPHMQEQKWGRIINITSISAKQPIPDLVISSTIRPGILGLSRVLATQYAHEGILINSVAPGYFMTARQKEISTKRAAEKNLGIEEYLQQAAADIPMRRYGTPDELADVIVFLGSVRASYLTGATVSVDGGLSKGLF
jgi:3-oxoacyl-[acyl-carrier protein] reductase